MQNPVFQKRTNDNAWVQSCQRERGSSLTKSGGGAVLLPLTTEDEIRELH